jgi:hypothetical protein
MVGNLPNPLPPPEVKNLRPRESQFRKRLYNFVHQGLGEWKLPRAVKARRRSRGEVQFIFSCFTVTNILSCVTYQPLLVLVEWCPTLISKDSMGHATELVAEFKARQARIRARLDVKRKGATKFEARPA